MAVGIAERPTIPVPPHRAAVADLRECAIAGLFALATSGIYVGIAWAHGAIGVARNDDWAYYRIAQGLAMQGVFRLDGWAETLFVGQASLAWPIIKIFGDGIAPLQITVAVLAAVGLWAAYLVIRSFLSRGWSTFAVACLAVGPIYGNLSVSFMTDVPSFALQALTLLAGLRALRPRSPSVPWFVAALGLGLAAFSIREYGIAAGLAVCFVVLRRARSVDRQLVVRIAGAATLWVVALAGIFLWRRALPNSISPRLDFSISGIASSIGTSYLGCLSLALFISPVAVVISPVRLVRTAWTRERHATVMVVCSMAAIAVVVAAIPRRPFLGNYFGRYGSYANSLPGPHPQLLADWMSEILRLVGFATLVAVGLLSALRRARARPSALIASGDRQSTASEGCVLVGAFVAISIALALLAILATDAPFYDRYLIALIPFTAALAIHPMLDRRFLAHRGGVRAAVALGILGLIGLTFIDASATVDGAKWQLARSIQRQGFQPTVIDGGQEWFGYHQHDAVRPRPRVKGRGYWVALFSERATCVTVTLRAPRRADVPGAEVRPELIRRLKVRSLMGIQYQLNAITGPQRC